MTEERTNRTNRRTGQRGPLLGQLVAIDAGGDLLSETILRTGWALLLSRSCKTSEGLPLLKGW